MHFQNENKKLIFECTVDNWQSKAETSILNDATIWSLFFGYPFGECRSLKICHLMAANQSVFVLFDFLVFVLYLIGWFHHRCGQNQNWSKHELGCR